MQYFRTLEGNYFVSPLLKKKRNRIIILISLSHGIDINTLGFIYHGSEVKDWTEFIHKG